MDDSLYDKCNCGATKIAIKEKCTNCWLDSQHYDWMVDRDKTSVVSNNEIKDRLYDMCDCGARKIASKEKCTNCWLDSQNYDWNGDEINAPVVPNNEIKKCIYCKNHAKKDSRLCGPCLKTEEGICGERGCDNRINVAKRHRYCGLHNGTRKSQNRSIQSNNSKNQIQCRVCKKTLQPRSVGERAVRGTTGAGMGTVVGGIIGSLGGPLGTLVGAGIGGFFGSTDGSQIENLCGNCCRFCENKKSECICNDIIGLCRSCGCKVTRSNSSNGFCWGCQGSWFGDDL